MPKIIFHTADGHRHTVDARVGSSVMENAVRNGIPGILAECGGALACATCHVYICEDFIDTTGTAGEFESELLEDTASERRPTSRLSCQIRITDELDLLEAEIAPEQ